MNCNKFSLPLLLTLAFPLALTFSFNQPAQSQNRFVESPDKKLRLLSTPIEDQNEDQTDYIIHYKHALEYGIGYDGKTDKTRTTYLYNRRCFSFATEDLSELVIDTIYHVHNTTYLLEGFSGINYYLLGVDIGRGIAKDAYILQNLDTHKPVCFISFPIDTIRYPMEEAIEKVRAHISGNMIRLPRPTGESFSGGYSYQYFNGAHYEGGVSHVETMEKMEDSKEIITRMYFKEETNRKAVSKLYPGQIFSVVIDIASPKDSLKAPLSLRLENTEKHEHFQGKYFNIRMPLKPIGNTVFIEGLDSYHFPPITSPKTPKKTSLRNLFKKKLRRVEYTAGRKSALPYEWLRYSAVIFNRPLEDKEYNRIHWALEIDGELQLLEGKKHQGPQIDIQIQEEWLNKTIRVIPYIKGNPINHKVAIETAVVVY